MIANALALSNVAFLARAGASDPLAGIPFSIRLQTHIPGSNTPLGLYQDIACTIPATQDGDPIAAWRDELSDSGLVAIQADTQKQPMLVFEASVPTIMFDGVDDFLKTTTFTLVQPEQVFAGAIFNGPQVTNDTLLDGNASNSMRLYRSLDLAVALFAGSFFPDKATTPESWHVYEPIFNGVSSQLRIDEGSVTTADAGSDPASGMTVGAMGGGGECGPVSVVCLMVCPSILTEADRELVNTYCQNLLP